MNKYRPVPISTNNSVLYSVKSQEAAENKRYFPKYLTILASSYLLDRMVAGEVNVGRSVLFATSNALGQYTADSVAPMLIGDAYSGTNKMLMEYGVSVASTLAVDRIIEGEFSNSMTKAGIAIASDFIGTWVNDNIFN